MKKHQFDEDEDDNTNSMKKHQFDEDEQQFEITPIRHQFDEDRYNPLPILMKMITPQQFEITPRGQDGVLTAAGFPSALEQWHMV